MPTDLMRMAAMPTGGGGDNKVSVLLTFRNRRSQDAGLMMPAKPRQRRGF
jgi:hypothetical protein